MKIARYFEWWNISEDLYLDAENTENKILKKNKIWNERLDVVSPKGMRRKWSGWV